jgi:hypothetical protein
MYFSCMDDDAAIAKARKIFPRDGFEVWEGARRVYTTQVESVRVADVGRKAPPKRGQ